MTALTRRTKNAFARIHNEEEGMEVLQVVLIIAVAAIVLAFVFKITGGNEVSNNTDNSTTNNITIFGWVISQLDMIFSWE